VNVVWFKRDLRISDHRALYSAAERGSVLPLYIVEPDYWRQPDASARHWRFLRASLDDLNTSLSALGQPLVIRVGNAPDVFRALHADTPIAALFSHEETGNGWTYARDRAVGLWASGAGVRWHELPQHGVFRPNRTRKGWAARWRRRMSEPLVQVPAALKPPPPVASEALPTAEALGLADDACPGLQNAGRAAALNTLESFLTDRGVAYRRAMSSPTAGARGCSRLSTYLAVGTLSVREVVQATEFRRQTLAPALDPRWSKSLEAFSSRLYWHCHFMQKLEDEPSLEFRNLHPAYDGLRAHVDASQRLNAWRRGETGIPFVDACMRSLLHSGWINFRMRAMLMSFASYQLWLDWRQPGEHLARLFADYEPGIHWSQAQMQSGTTGINAARIYNPVKQGYDQDPGAGFVRRWIPELRAVPDAFVQEPWRWPGAGTLLGKAYPAPIVDHLAAARAARKAIHEVRRGAGYRKAARDIFERHGSRKRQTSRQGNLFARGDLQP